MKILHICKVYFPTYGGVQTVVDWLSSGMTRFGWSSIVLSTSDRNTAPVNINKVDVFTVRAYGELLSMPIAPQIIIKAYELAEECDIVCVHYPFPLMDLAFAFTRPKSSKLVIYWHSEIVSQKITSKLLLPLTKRLLSNADAIVCSSPSLLEYSKLLSKVKDKCRIIPFGMPNAYRLDEAKEPIKPSESDYFLMIGRHVNYKGIDVLLSAFEIFVQVEPQADFRLKIVGNGPLFEEHIQMARSKGIFDRIDFVRGALSDEVQNLIRACRCLVLPSRLPSEAFALVQLEAMAHGRPIVNTHLKSGVPWVARNGIEAITVEPDNCQQLSEALVNIGKSNILADELGVNAKNRFDGRFTHERFSSDTDRLFRSLLN